MHLFYEYSHREFVFFCSPLHNVHVISVEHKSSASTLSGYISVLRYSAHYRIDDYTDPLTINKSTLNYYVITIV